MHAKAQTLLFDTPLFSSYNATAVTFTRKVSAPGCKSYCSVALTKNKFVREARAHHAFIQPEGYTSYCSVQFDVCQICHAGIVNSLSLEVKH